MDIKSLTLLKAPSNKGLYDLFNPQIIRTPSSDLTEYIVQKGEEMRIDLVMLSMYDEDRTVLENIDIICFINDLDNPLNIYTGQKLYYPPSAQLDSYRILVNQKNSTSQVKNKLAVPNKTTRKDNNRSKYVENGYSLPPVVLNTPQAPVRLEGQSILVGGVSKN
jgi:hypothetical protein